MKTKELDLTQDVELTINPTWQDKPFVITGIAEAVLPIADAVQAADAVLPKQVVHKASRVGSKLIEASTHITEGLVGRIAVDVKTVAYDRVHGTSFFQSLQEKRADERNLKFATSIGLISLEDVSCRKHEHAVAKMRGL